MRLFLEPTEPLLFRTGRPFDAGESSFAETVFPPTPETLQGAIRAAIATYRYPTITLEEAFSKPELVDLVGNRSSYGRFHLTSIALGRRKEDETIERLFPSPSHLATLKDAQGNKQLLRLKPKKMKGVISDQSESDEWYYLLPEKEVKSKLEPLKCWLTEDGLAKALRTDEPLNIDEMVCEEKIYQRESRLGISMDNSTKTTLEGFLYQSQLIRMESNYGFVIDIRLRKPDSHAENTSTEFFTDDVQTQHQLRLPNDGWITFGGERRTAHFKVLPHGKNQISQIEREITGNLLYLATPAAFDGGWQPKQWIPPFVPPIIAAINHYQPIGGWALNPGDSGGRSKTMRRCVPAGSIYYFDQQVTIKRPLTDYGMEIGYGITYTGKWEK